MLVLAIERWKDGAAGAVYARLAETGRGLPPSVSVHGSWLDEKLRTCWQVMEGATPQDLEAWKAYWDDLMEIDLVPVLTGQQAQAQIPMTRDRDGGS